MDKLESLKRSVEADPGNINKLISYIKEIRRIDEGYFISESSLKRNYEVQNEEFYLRENFQSFNDLKKYFDFLENSYKDKEIVKVRFRQNKRIAIFYAVSENAEVYLRRLKRVVKSYEAYKNLQTHEETKEKTKALKQRKKQLMAAKKEYFELKKLARREGWD